jgi:hypothetical protein
MKKLFYSLLSFLLTAGAANAQNTFPATGNAKLTGTNTLEFGGGVVKDPAAGSIAYQKFSDALDIVGAGTTGGNRKLKFWAEGGSLFTGGVSIFNNSSTSTNLILSANYATAYRWRMKTLDRGNAIDLDFTASDAADTEEAVLQLSRSNSTRPEFRVMNDWLVVNNGNVGIGTTPNSNAGSYKLAVAGTIGAWGEVRVFTTGTSFPDYVFDPAYQLPSLEETEKYVKENRHLPEVPSAADIEKDGMSLNGMNTILLKKVEELTLYMIEMKKKTEELEKEIKELKENQKK